jgi:DUF1365 family protein
VKHQFRYRVFMVYLELAELPELVGRGGLISDRRFAGASLLRRDHWRGSAGSLDQATRDLVEARTQWRPRGPIRLLTQLRYFGYYFSPLNLYYCFDAAGDEIDAIVAEVSNTPWGEQHAYVLWAGNRIEREKGLSYVHQKSFHVSPFIDMHVDYRWKLTRPGDSLSVQITNTRGGEPFFRAGMAMTRCPLTRWHLTRAMIRCPLMTARIVTAIYYQALRLWMKKCPYYPHPNRSEASSRSLT